MNLWIRSQDKKKLVNINAVNILEFEALIAIHGYINSETHFWLGNYKTKERALEVLDEIHKCIVDKEVLDGCNNILTLANNKSLNEVNQILGRAEKIAVYEMPKD